MAVNGWRVLKASGVKSRAGVGSPVALGLDSAVADQPPCHKTYVLHHTPSLTRGCCWPGCWPPPPHPSQHPGTLLEGPPADFESATLRSSM